MDFSLYDEQRARFPDSREEGKERECTPYDEQRARFPEPKKRREKRGTVLCIMCRGQVSRLYGREERQELFSV